MSLVIATSVATRPRTCNSSRVRPCGTSQILGCGNKYTSFIGGVLFCAGLEYCFFYLPFLVLNLGGAGRCRTWPYTWEQTRYGVRNCLFSVIILHHVPIPCVLRSEREALYSLFVTCSTSSSRHVEIGHAGEKHAAAILCLVPNNCFEYCEQVLYL